MKISKKMGLTGLGTIVVLGIGVLAYRNAQSVHALRMTHTVNRSSEEGGIFLTHTENPVSVRTRFKLDERALKTAGQYMLNRWPAPDPRRIIRLPGTDRF